MSRHALAHSALQSGGCRGSPSGRSATCTGQRLLQPREERAKTELRPAEVAGEDLPRRIGLLDPTSAPVPDLDRCGIERVVVDPAPCGVKAGNVSGHDTAQIDVLKDRQTELATTLAGLAAQTGVRLRVVIADQSDGPAAYATPAATMLISALRRRGSPVELLRNLPRRGIAEQRSFLLSQATAPAVLFLDDDVWLEPGVIQRLRDALYDLGCGFVTAAMQGLSHLDDRRPEECTPFEVWNGPVEPETVAEGGPQWGRWTLGNAANGVHLAELLGLDLGTLPPPARWVAYKIAWAAGCVLFDRAALLEAGGFDFWRELPAGGHGEDVLVQLRVMARRGGAGILPSGAYHQQSPTSIPVRSASAVDVLSTERI